MLSRPLRAALYLTLGLSLIHLVFFGPFVLVNSSSELIGNHILWLVILSLADSAIVSGLFFFSSSVFSDYLATYRRLLRLENLSHPLLVRLSVEAPGTYHHSILLANLTYNAAKKIGADAILARVGAYYHDIGKLKYPEFFVENQSGGDNPHDSLDPRQSAEHIKNHVKDGQALAAEYHLPDEVMAFIREHQGTTPISYFEKKANDWLQEGKLEWVRQEDFRYDGPKPESREIAILMLADSVEAKVRSLPEVTEEAIRKVVDETIAERKQEGELANSHLTDADLANIAASFTETLGTIYHRRISYPAKKKLFGRPKKNVG